MTPSKEPLRIAEDPEASDELRALLDRARLEEPLDAAAVERIVARVDALGPKASASALTASKPMLLAGLGVLLLLAMGALYWALRAPEAADPRPLDASHASQEGASVRPAPRIPESNGAALPASPEVMPAEVVSAEVAPAEVAPAELVPAEVAPAEVVPAEVVSAEATGAARSAEERSEGAILLEARRLLASHPARALALTREHERRFAHGPMEEEREVIAIEALLALDQGGRAAERRTRFELRHPSSPYAARVRGLFERSEAP